MGWFITIIFTVFGVGGTLFLFHLFFAEKPELPKGPKYPPERKPPPPRRGL